MTVKELLSCLEVVPRQEVRIISISNDECLLDTTLDANKAMSEYKDLVVSSFTTGYGYHPVLRINVEA